MDQADEILRQLHQEDPWFSYPDAVDLLSRLEPAALPALDAALADPSAKIRAAVARALGAYDAAATRPLLCRALADAAPDVRRAAVGALGDQAGSAAVDLLAGALRDDPDRPTRLAAVQALAGSGDPAVAPLLRDWLAGATPDDLWAVGEAVAALVAAGPALALAPLLALLDHPEAALREQALAGLADLGDPAAAAPLQRHAAREPDPYLAAQTRALAAALATGA